MDVAIVPSSEEPQSVAPLSSPQDPRFSSSHVDVSSPTSTSFAFQQFTSPLYSGMSSSSPANNTANSTASAKHTTLSVPPIHSTHSH